MDSRYTIPTKPSLAEHTNLLANYARDGKRHLSLANQKLRFVVITPAAVGHSTTRTLERYVSNTFASHRQAVCTLQDRVRKVIVEGVAKADGVPPAEA